MMSEDTLSTQEVEQKPVTILQVLPALGAGGAERGCVDVAAAIVQAGARALVTSEGGLLEHDLRRVGGEHVTLPLASKNPLVMYRNVDRLVELCRAEGVDIIHARSRAPAWSARAAARRLGIPYMTTVHAPYNAKSGLKRFYNSIMARGDRVIAISQYVARYVQETYHTPPDLIRVVPRGVDVENFDPERVSAERVIKLASDWQLPDGKQVILMPGRLTRWKGQGVLIEAMARISHRHDVLCLIVGDDQGRIAYREELEDQIKRNHLANRVRLMSHCRDMAAAYKLADIVVHASTDPEGFGRVIAEAQAMERLVIATNIGAPPEVIAPGTGWLVPPGDAPALADALEEALSVSPDRRSQMARQARAFVCENFTREAMVNRTLGVYSELLGFAEPV
ncbi:glycosyltransferase family 4 protein [Radicibacter daui]|uniref:glycosyltransferase family 4 protein n=1 Tax=Radicibacter daui TaxID=3064829 RepID=UPI004046DBAF